MTPAARALAQRIVDADALFKEGQFDASYESARALLHEVNVEVAGDRAAQWRAELLGLAGRCALHLGRLDEALTATRDAIRGIHDLHDDKLWPLLEGVRENLLTILAAREPRDADGEAAMSHRALRRQILRAQSLTDRWRFTQSLDVLEPLLRGLQALGPLTSDSSAAPADVRLWYLPRVQGLLGFNWFHRGDLARAKALTSAAIETCRALGDRSGERAYAASLERVEKELSLTRTD
jgi:tetratricopeptide (TPR) repeat protein